MTDEELNKLTSQEQINMLHEIDKNYKELDLPEINPIYDSEGNIKNEKEIKAQLKKILAIVTILWLTNSTIIDNSSIKTTTYTFSYYNALKQNLVRITAKEIKELSKTTMSSKKWTKIINKLVKERQKTIKIKQVIKGNANVLNRKLQNKIVSMYKAGKTKPQIAKEISKTMGYNKNKAKSIAMTEVNYYKSEAQIQATKGLNIKKTWIHNPIAKEPRDSHIQADGQTVIGNDTMFNVGGIETIAPQHFGIASEDINCHCTMQIEIIE